MEISMYSINSIRNMEVIDVSTGAKLGYIKDLKVDCDNSKIISIIIPIQKSSWFSKYEVLEIPWESIIKVGLDVILVDNDNTIEEI